MDFQLIEKILSPLLLLPPELLITLMLVIPFVIGLLGIVPLWMKRGPLYHRALDVYSWLTFATSCVLLPLSVLLFRQFEIRGEAFHTLPHVSFILFSLDLHIDALSLYFVVLVNTISWFASWNALRFPEGDPESKGNLQSPAFFHLSVNMFHVTMLLVPLVDNLIALWIAIELTTVFSALTVGYYNQRDSWDAAWKYLLITSTGIILALLGTMFFADAISPLTTSTDPHVVPVMQAVLDPKTGLPLDSIMNWSFLMKVAQSGMLSHSPEQGFVILSFLFIVVGYGTKAGLAPMHTWLPDGHGEAPAPMSALLSGVLLKCAFYAILRFYTLANAVAGDATLTSLILLCLGLFSLLLSVPFILKDNRFKRILAFHSLEHMGIIAMAIAIGGLVADNKNLVPIASITVYAGLLHIFNHATTKSLMFLSYGNIQRAFKAIESSKTTQPPKTSYQAIFKMPWTASMLILGALALVGMPPFNIFMSEFNLIWGAINEVWAIAQFSTLWPLGWIIIVSIILFMISTILISIGLLRHLGGETQKRPEQKEDLIPAKQKEDLRETVFDVLPLFVLFLLILLSGIALPNSVSDLLNGSVKAVLGLNNYP
ncbi:MAG: proton-conducting transporter membrane subunit [Anaerolineae bacterium]